MWKIQVLCLSCCNTVNPNIRISWLWVMLYPWTQKDYVQEKGTTISLGKSEGTILFCSSMEPIWTRNPGVNIPSPKTPACLQGYVLKTFLDLGCAATCDGANKSKVWFCRAVFWYMSWSQLTLQLHYCIFQSRGRGQRQAGERDCCFQSQSLLMWNLC